MSVHVIGMGPGNLDYVIPIAMEKIKRADVLIAGKRHLEQIDASRKEVITIDANLSYIADYIRENHLNKKIAVLVSGDPGFHSILSYLRRVLKGIPIEVVPGLSSIAYFFTKLSMPWQDAVFSSVHGEETDYIKLVKENKVTAFLTDNKTTPKVIAREMLIHGIDKSVYIGENLSYGDEKISKLNVEEAAEYEAANLCVVVISDE